VAPVVHQLDHFLDELIAIADGYIHAPSSGATDTTASQTGARGRFGSDLSRRYKPRNTSKQYVDRAWQAIAASQCLFDCEDSVAFP
jgi:hypothetical protein